jgi:glucose/arabinose dehydrogenase
MYSSDHGDEANDELNIIKKGENYGWPDYEGNNTETG